MIETIVIADDGSEGAAKAVDLASNFAAQYGAKISILHAVQPDHISDKLLDMAEREHLVPRESEPVLDLGGSTGVLSASRGLEREQRRLKAAEGLGRQILNRAEATARGKGVEEVSTKLAVGDPVQEILAHVKDLSADLVVTGARGLGTLKGLLVGSVSHKVTNLAPCTCVVVK